MRLFGIIALAVSLTIGVLLFTNLRSEFSDRPDSKVGEAVSRAQASVAADANETQSATLGPVLPAPITSEVWDDSAKRTLNAIATMIASERIDDALKLTRQALSLPRHPDRNDPYGWRHATLALPHMLYGLVQAERWDELIELATSPSAKQIGNEWVESYRLRALALAFWSKRQFVFRSTVLSQELKDLKSMLANRRHEGEMWNQISMPQDQIPVDFESFETAENHIAESLQFISRLESSDKKSISMEELKQGFAMNQAVTAERVTESNPDQVIDPAELGLNLTAPSFSLPDADGEFVSLADSDGRPTLLVFYLGRGCIHCIKQLKEFGPRIESFEKAGVIVLGVSTEKQADLYAAVMAFEGRIPLNLLADGDTDLALFRQYGLVPNELPDDAEALHATILIDGSGKILWRDAGVEPFTDIKYLYREVTRLISDQK